MPIGIEKDKSQNQIYFLEVLPPNNSLCIVDFSSLFGNSFFLGFINLYSPDFIKNSAFQSFNVSISYSELQTRKIDLNDIDVDGLQDFGTNFWDPSNKRWQSILSRLQHTTWVSELAFFDRRHWKGKTKQLLDTKTMNLEVYLNVGKTTCEY